jgi:hypothetical protein
MMDVAWIRQEARSGEACWDEKMTISWLRIFIEGGLIYRLGLHSTGAEETMPRDKQVISQRPEQTRPMKKRYDQPPCLECGVL